MLQKDPAYRIGIYDIIDDPWVTDDGENLIDLDLISSDSEEPDANDLVS